MNSEFDGLSKKPSVLIALALIVLPIATLASGYAAAKSQLFVAGVFVLGAIANVLFAFTYDEAKRPVGSVSTLFQFGGAFLSGFALVGQFACAGLLILWFI